MSPRRLSTWATGSSACSESARSRRRSLRRAPRIPDLRGTAKVQRRRAADDRAVARGAEKVRLQLDGREAARPRGQRGDAAVAGARVGQRHHGGGVQVTIRGHDLTRYGEPALNQSRLDRENFHTEKARQMAGAETLEVVG